MRVKRCLAACLLAAIPALSHAAPDYDPSLEAAAVRLAADRLGPLREGFELDEEPTYYRQSPQKTETQDGAAVTWRDGLAPATDLPPKASSQP